MLMLEMRQPRTMSANFKATMYSIIRFANRPIGSRWNTGLNILANSIEYLLSHPELAASVAEAGDQRTTKQRANVRGPGADDG